jgi:aldose 1-epimerase
MLTLASEELTLSVVPEIGGGIARLDWTAGDRPVPLFRAWDGTNRSLNSLGLYVLVPWSNRISGGGIEAGGRFWALSPNLPPEPCPIHGDGWQKPWRVETQDETTLRLELVSGDQPPFDYRAELTYALDGPRLRVGLAVEHRGDVPAPYGLGLHPWLPRTPLTTLEAPAARAWLETGEHLPDGSLPVRERPEWDFSMSRPLPASWINNGFDGWIGKARVRWPEHGLALSIAASPELATCIVFSPGAEAGFFCLEPVTHPVDAFNLPGAPGLRLLHRGERFAVSCQFTGIVEPGG